MPNSWLVCTNQQIFPVEFCVVSAVPGTRTCVCPSQAKEELHHCCL